MAAVSPRSGGYSRRVTEKPAVTIDDVRDAVKRLGGALERTPLTHSQTLSEIVGATVHLKFENLQYTGSFKGRGARNRLLNVAPGTGVVAMSAGNHAQGVAYHGSLLGLETTIVMPENTPFVKVARTRDLGATVELAGGDVMEAAGHALALAEERGLEFIHPFNDPVVIAGQGTVGIEMLEQEPELDVILAAVGGGGLASGIAVAASDHRRPVRVIGVQTERYPARPQGAGPGGQRSGDRRSHCDAARDREDRGRGRGRSGAGRMHRVSRGVRQSASWPGAMRRQHRPAHLVFGNAARPGESGPTQPHSSRTRRRAGATRSGLVDHRRGPRQCGAGGP